MATVKEVMDVAARRCSVSPPSSWITATDKTSLELKDLLAEVVEEVLDRLDLPDPITKDTVITYTGSEPIDLPSDFLRLTRDPLAIYETTTTRRRGIPVMTNGMWTHLEELGSAGGDRYYRLSGDDADGFAIEFYRPLSDGDSVTVSYVSENWLKTSGTAGATWTAAEDTLLLPADIVRLGVVWRFKQRKGLPFSDIMAEYEARISRRINDGRGIRSVNMGGGEMRAPWDVPVPDYIPSS